MQLWLYTADVRPVGYCSDAMNLCGIILQFSLNFVRFCFCFNDLLIEFKARS